MGAAVVRASAPRERLLAAAADLFAREGIRGVGVQAVADAAGTTKMAIYRHFETKDELVAAWLRELADGYQQLFDDLAARHPGDPRAQVLALAEEVAAGLGPVAGRGCAFANSLAELPDPAHPARRVVLEHKARQVERLTALCAGAGAADPGAAAAEITFLLEGAQVAAQNGSVPDPGRRLVAAVGAVLDRAVPVPTARRGARRRPAPAG
ncbi:TetR/AcrR family transcriptional regulator [Kineococcus sp. NUM-3379]